MTTVRAYRQDLAKFVAFHAARAPADADKPMCADIDRNLLRQYQIELAALLPHPRTRARALVALRRFLTYAYDEGWTTSELSRHVQVPTYVQGDPHPIPTELVPQLLSQLPSNNLLDLRDRALVYFLISTGCRISEACAVNHADIRPEGFRVLGKGGKHRTVYCTTEALHAIADYLTARGVDHSPALFISLSSAERPKGHIGKDNRLTPSGARYALAMLRRRFATTVERSTLIASLRTPHVARHTTATTLLEATDGDVRLVQDVLGHATLETLRVYTEITDKRKRAAYTRLETFFNHRKERT